jgi:hypothetical protein
MDRGAGGYKEALTAAMLTTPLRGRFPILLGEGEQRIGGGQVFPRCRRRDVDDRQGRIFRRGHAIRRGRGDAGIGYMWVIQFLVSGLPFGCF